MNYSHRPPAPAATDASWFPAIDIIELADRFELQADLPGVAPDDIEINLDGRLLKLSGERRSAVADAKRQRGERVMGKFSRHFTLPDSVDSEAIEAQACNGTLRLRIPKAAQSLPRQIAVHID